MFWCQKGGNPFYYIEASVLLEKRPLVKFIRRLHPGPSWDIFISSLVRISIMLFPDFARLFLKSFA